MASREGSMASARSKSRDTENGDESADGQEEREQNHEHD